MLQGASRRVMSHRDALERISILYFDLLDAHYTSMGWGCAVIAERAIEIPDSDDDDEGGPPPAKSMKASRPGVVD